jgi:TfoX/Sxy family transcriptional regulator of competence genes
LPWKNSIKEKRMFGWNYFLYKVKMCVGKTKQQLMIRVISAKMERVLKIPYILPMDFTEKPMKEFVFVTKKGFDTELKLQKWIELGIKHATIKRKI